MTHNPDDKRREWAASAREGLADEAERLQRDGPTLHRHHRLPLSYCQSPSRSTIRARNSAKKASSSGPGSAIF